MYNNFACLLVVFAYALVAFCDPEPGVKNMTLPLRRHQNYYAVETHFTLEDDATEEQKKNKIYMNLGLNTDKTFIAGQKCFGYTTYDALKIKVQKDETPKPSVISYPNTYISGNFAGAGLKLSMGSFEIKPEDQITVADQCRTKPNGDFPASEEAVGVLGLGIHKENPRRFNSEINSFAIVLPDTPVTQSGSSFDGELVFNPNFSNEGEKGHYINSFPCNGNWTITYLRKVSVGSYVGTGKYNFSISFDMNLDFIGVPADIYEAVTTGLKQAGLKCSANSRKGKCLLEQPFNTLPNISFNIAEKVLEITPDVYLRKDRSLELGEVYTNLRVLEGHGDNYVTEEFHETIILGAPFFRKYPLVFDVQENPQVRVYDPNAQKPQPPLPPKPQPEDPKNPENKDHNGWRYFAYVCIVLLVVLAIALGYLFWKKKTQAQNLQAGLLQGDSQEYQNAL